QEVVDRAGREPGPARGGHEAGDERARRSPDGVRGIAAAQVEGPVGREPGRLGYAPPPARVQVATTGEAPGVAAVPQVDEQTRCVQAKEPRTAAHGAGEESGVLGERGVRVA